VFEGGQAVRVLEVITGGEAGGAQRHVAELTRFLVGQGLTVTVAHGGGDWIDSLVGEYATIVGIPELTREIDWRADRRAAQVLERLMRDGYDVVHAHSSKAGILTRWVGPRVGLPVVYTAHGLVFQDPTWSIWRRRLFHQLEHWAAHRSAAIITMTPADYAWAVARVGAGRAYLIPNGVRAPRHVRLRQPSDPPRIGFLGRLSPEKGLDVLFEAARLRPGWQWLIAGDGPLQETVRRKTASMTHLRWVGWQENPQAFLETVDVLVQPSWKEGAPYAVLDAMALGVVPVVSRVGAQPEMVGPVDPALVVEPGQPQALIAAIEYGLAHYSSLSRAAQQVVQATFDAEVSWNHTLAVLCRVVQR